MENHETYENRRERQREVQKLTLAVLAVMTVIIIGYVAWGIAREIHEYYGVWLFAGRFCNHLSCHV